MAFSKEPKIVFWDLETLPNLNEVLKVYAGISNYPGLSLRASITSIICFGFKVLGKGSAHVLCAWDYPEWSRDVNNDKLLVSDAYKILYDADVIVTHNGKRFDFKFFQTRLIKWGLPPLPKILHIDTCQEAKKNLFLFNNRLNTVSDFLLEDKKHEHEGWEMWVKVHARQKKAMDEMARYCKKDVILLEKVFEKIKPLISSLPNRNLLSGTHRNVCPICESTRLQSRGRLVTKTRIYRRYQCSDCGSWSRTDSNDRLPRAI